jgi:hypothetical protein
VYQGKDPFFQKHIGLMAIFLPDGVNSVMRLSNSLRTAGTKASRALRRGVLALSLATTTLALPVLAIAPGDGSSELAIVPAGSAVVIHLKGVLGTKDRLLAYLEKAVPDQAAIAKTFIDQAFEDGIDGRKPFSGINKNGPIFITLPELPKPGQDSDPKVVAFLKADDFNAFVNGAFKEEERKGAKKEGNITAYEVDGGKTLYVANHKGFATVSNDRDALKKAMASTEGVKIEASQAAKLLGADIGFHVGLDRLAKDYADQVKEGRKQIEDGIKQAEEQLPKEQREQFAIVKELVAPAFQALEDSQGLIGTIEFKPESLVLGLDTALRSGTNTAKALEGLKPSANKVLPGLPSGKMMYMGATNNGALIKAALPYLKKLAPDGGKALEASAGNGSAASAVGIPLAGIDIREVEDAAVAAKAALSAASDSLSSPVGKTPIKGKPKVTADAATIGDIKFSKLEMEIDIESLGNQEGLPEEMKAGMVKAMKSMLGEKITIWIGGSDKVLYQITAPTEAIAKELFEQAKAGKDSLGSTEGYKVVSSTLPADATLVALVDPVKYGSLIVNVLKDVVGGALPIPEGLGKVKNPKSVFFGASIGLEPGHAVASISLPAATINEMVNVFAKPFLP